MAPTPPDLTGLVFGKWTVVSRDLSRLLPGVRWDCVCECGTQRSVSSITLKAGTSRSCGCLHRELARKRFTKHGQSAKHSITSEYLAWTSMRDRCLSPGHKFFEYYGGRGITPCVGWNTFESFFASMGTKPSPCHTLDRLERVKNVSQLVRSLTVNGLQWRLRAGISEVRFG